MPCTVAANIARWGSPRAACPRPGILRARGAPLDRAAASVCREAVATVATKVLVRGLNVAPSQQNTSTK